MWGRSPRSLASVTQRVPSHHPKGRIPDMESSATAPASAPAPDPAAGPPVTADPRDRQIVAWYAGFAAFAGLVFLGSGQPVQWTWAAFAAGGYAIAALTAGLWRRRGRQAALIIALAGAVAAPLTWQVTFGSRMSKVGEGPLQVVARSAVLLLRHGTPYLPTVQVSHVLAYDPYEPAMAIFGLPRAWGLAGAAGNPRLWLSLTGVAILAVAFALERPGSALSCTVFAVGSPVVAMPLTTGQTDLPVLALLCLTLACADPGRQLQRAWLTAGLALGAACAIKAIAWPALPVVAAMLAARDGVRTAGRFAVTTVGTTAALIVATTPASVLAPAALFQNTVLFPLGLARYQTLAASPLPGHLLATTGSAGRWVAIGLLCAAGLAIAASLVIRPPADLRAAAWRLALGLALLFTLAPGSRWGYFIYPAALLGFVAMTSARPTLAARRSATPDSAAPDSATPDNAVPRPASASSQVGRDE